MLQQLQQLKAQYLNGDIDFNQYMQGVSQVTQGVQITPELMQFDPTIVQQEKQARSQAGIMQGYNIASGLTDIARQLGVAGIAANQISTSNQGLAQAAPGVPVAPGPSPELSQSLYEAQRRAADVGYAVNPAMQQLDQGYNQGLAVAQATSGGQAANFQGQANLLNNQRMRAALGLVPVAQETRLQNQAVANDLLGQKMQEQQRMFQNQMATNQVAQERYNLGQQAYGQAGAYGRYNLANILQNFKLPEYFSWLPIGEEEKTNWANTEKRYNNGGLTLPTIPVKPLPLTGK